MQDRPRWPARVREALAKSRSLRPRRAHGGRAAAPPRAEAEAQARLRHWPSGPASFAPPPRGRAARRAATRALGSPGGGPRSRAGPGRRVHRGRPVGGRRRLLDRPTRRPADVPRSRARPCRRTIPKSSTTAATAEEQRRLGPRGLRGRVEAVHPLRLPEPARVARGPRRALSPRTRRTRPRTSCSGTLLLASGRADEAVREWQEARRLDPRMPVLHRNLGLTLLQSRGRRRGRAAGFEEGMSADPTNVDLYQGADQALSLLGRGRPRAHRGAPALSRPRADAARRSLQAVALALAEAGRADEAEALFSGRFFPREECGTNVRQVYLEIRLREAMAWRRPGTRPRRRRSWRGSASPCRGSTSRRTAWKRSWTRRASSTTSASYRPRLATTRRRASTGDARRPAATCGRRRSPIAPRSGSARRAEAEWRPRLEAALAEADTYLFRGGHYPALATLGRGLLLRALGRTAEGDEALRQVFTLPDKGMPHHMARLALEER